MTTSVLPRLRMLRPVHGVVWVETRDDLLGDGCSERQRERATGRHCARAALAALADLADLGRAAPQVGSDRDGVPSWPSGYVGSITHCPGYRAAAVAESACRAAVGIDAEPHAPLPDGVADVVLGPGERDAWPDLPGVHVDRLAFSAKEAAYKAVFPTAREPLDPTDVVVRLAPGRFTALLATRRPRSVDGTWWVRDGLVLTLLTA